MKRHHTNSLSSPSSPSASASSLVPDLEETSSQSSSVAGASPRTPTTSPLTFSPLTQWSRDTSDIDFHSRFAAHFAIPASTTIRRNFPRLHRPAERKGSSIAPSGRSDAYAPSTTSSTPPAIPPPALALDFTGGAFDHVPSMAADGDAPSTLSLSIPSGPTSTSTRTIASTAPSHRPPSLTASATTASTTSSASLRTNRAGDVLARRPLLLHDDGTGALVDPRSSSTTATTTTALPPHLPCAFWFLECAFRSSDTAEWKTHCLAHLHPHTPPRSASCPLCSFCSRGPEAWEARMEHVAREHHEAGQGLEESRPDFELFRWLWKKRVIGDAVLKELEGDFEGRRGEFLSTVTEGAVREGRREGVGMRRGVR